MAKNLLDSLPEVFLSTAGISTHVSRAVSAGKARKIGPRLYTTNMTDAPESIVKRNLWPIVGLLFPDAVVGHRTALEGRPTADGTVFLTGRYTRTVTFPGLTVRTVKGPGPLTGDNQFIGGLWHASRARAFLENLKPSRKRSGPARTLPRQELQDQLERLLQVSGTEALNRLRDEAGTIASVLEAEREYAQLHKTIGTLLGTSKARLSAPAAIARVAGRPYDSGRLETFQALLAGLRQWEPVSRPSSTANGEFERNLAFIDAYFSNFIEGTEFSLNEAIEIVFENRIPERRPQDAHDILGTFRILSDPTAMRRSAVVFENDIEDFFAMIKSRHVTIMHARPDIRPGQFKLEVNRAGNTTFVDPQLVCGTLEKGLEFLRSLDTPFGRAAFMMFLIAEVHPFDDGNGRLARVMMNAELEAGGESRIIIPTVYREDYFGALRVLSRQNHALPFVQMLDYAQRFTALLDFSALDNVLATLRSCNAFDDTGDLRLRLPETTPAPPE